MPGLLRVYTITRPGFAGATESDVLIDRDGDAHRAYDVTKDALALVRPDGYIGLAEQGKTRAEAASQDEETAGKGPLALFRKYHQR
jgi:hypothetical protein